MDDSRRWISQGGTLEPVDRAAVARMTYQTPEPAAGPRFELRDATTDLTYHAQTFEDMVLKADRVAALRFTAIDAQGQRSFVHKVDGRWQRPPLLHAEPAREQDGAVVRGKEDIRETGRVSGVLPLKTEARPEGAVALIDAEAERTAMVARLETELSERYVIRRAIVSIGDTPVGQTEYRFRGDTSRVAFTESTFRLATDNNSPSVARSMVDVAQARDWKALRLSGHDEFRRMVWFEASLRDVKTIGYEPLQSEVARLKTEREARQINRIEPATLAAASSATKTSARGSGSRKTVLAAIEAVLVAQRVPEKRREAIIAAATANLAKRLAAGEVHKVKVLDRVAPQRRPMARPVPEQQHIRERAAHVR